MPVYVTPANMGYTTQNAFGPSANAFVRPFGSQPYSQPTSLPWNQNPAYLGPGGVNPGGAPTTAASGGPSPITNYPLSQANPNTQTIDPNNPAYWPSGTPGVYAPVSSVSATIPSGPVTGYNPSFGGVPSEPNPVATAGSAIGGNLGNLGSLYGLTTGTSGASAAGAATQIGQNLPGYQGMLDTSSGNIESLLQGNIPQDVQNLIAQQAAERGVSIGSPGSDNANASLIRSLGLTSLGLQQQGEGELTAAIGRTPTGPAFNPASMFVTPGAQQTASETASTLGAAPIPANAAATNFAAMMAGLGAGRGATGPTGPNPASYMPPPGSPSDTQGFGFGAGQTMPTSPLGGSSGPSDPSQDPSSWMNPQDLQLWNSLTPDQQYEEALMGYPSFFSDQGVTQSVPGQDTVLAGSGDQSGFDASNPSNWDMSALYGDGSGG